ncbi:MULTISPECIES: hypothetical protein [Burkholderia]|uniref:hypothetical protein n=1 Tax=Burkholderia TaxID=32008 RepID=UPI000CFFF9F9|nr:MULTISPECIES: hypothetical protein [Burkholderia]PRE01618.1 hypothetical protein C6P91_24010 [Burkholderia multivorans]
MPPSCLPHGLPTKREALARWLSVYREGQAPTEARATLAAAPAQLESLVSALEVAADTLSAADADHLWTQLQTIARTLKRAGHPRPRAARRPPAPLPGQPDFFDECDDLKQLAEQ